MAKGKRVFWSKELRLKIHEKAREKLLQGATSRQVALEIAMKEIAPPDQWRPMASLFHAEAMKFSKWLTKAYGIKARVKVSSFALQQQEQAQARAAKKADEPIPSSIKKDAAIKGKIDALINSGAIDPDAPAPHFDHTVVRAGQAIAAISALFQDVVVKPLRELNEQAAQRQREQNDNFLDRFAQMLRTQGGALTPPKEREEKAEETATGPADHGSNVLNYSPAKAKILIVSNMDNLDRVRREFPGLDIRYVHCNSARQIEAVSQNVEKTFVLSRFVGHAAQNSVKGKCVIVPPNYGQSGLIDRIAKEFPNTFRAKNGQTAQAH